MIDLLIEFFSFSQPNVRTVTLGTVLLGIGAAAIGCFTFLRKRALVGDAVSHAILPGLAVGFLLSGEKHPVYLIAGALLAGWLALLTIDYMVNNTKLKTDTAIALVLSVFFGFGVFLMSIIQRKVAGNQAGLDAFLFGKAAGMTTAETQVFAGVSLFILAVIVLFFNTFKIVSFNKDFAMALGIPVRWIEFLLATLTVLAITTGIQAVGVVLMSALLITPAAASRAFTKKLEWMVVIAAAIGAVGGLMGAFISFTQPQMPTGPWIVVTISGFAVAALLFAPQRGVVAIWRMRRNNVQKIRTENLIKAIYQLEEQHGIGPVTLEAVMKKRAFKKQACEKGLQNLVRNKWLQQTQGGFVLTPIGRDEGQRVVRLHRLWEVYLTQRLRMAPDHIHPQAETMEHLITPELEAQLIHELNAPEVDPHHSKIPYTN
jgi:manganese/zinc/iron transport system permease protein